MSNEKPAAQAAKGGNGAAKPVPVIPLGNFKLRGFAVNDWTGGLPFGMTKEHFPIGEVVSAPFVAAPVGIERFDEMTFGSNDDSFLVRLLVVEPSKFGCSALVLQVLDLPPRRGLEAGDKNQISRNIRVYQGTTEQGLVVERTNPDGSKQIVAEGRLHPGWSGDPEAARAWARDYNRTINR